jgi:4-hydroxy-4-methyl-2-oxoglutarate aldolase
MDRLSPAEMECLRRLSTCVVASSIERFGVRLPNTGFANSTIRAIFEDRPPVLGYAATARIRTSEPPMEGRGYYEHTEWWNHILNIPAPRMVVIEDLDIPAGAGALIGEVQTHILMKLGCVGMVTNGTVRDLDLVEPTGFQMFASGVAVSHAYAHVFDFGGKVSVGGLEVRPGDLIHGDLHGVQTIPLEIAAAVSQMAQNVMKRRQQLIGLVHSKDFSVETLRKAIQETEDFAKWKS